jgi:hypothetical protein
LEGALPFGAAGLMPVKGNLLIKDNPFVSMPKSF